MAQNPAWRRVAETLAGAVSEPARTAAAGRPAPDEPQVRARPELALEVPAPWPRELTLAALGVLLGGRLGWRASRYGAAIGARLAEADRDLLQQALDVLGEPGSPAQPGLRPLEEALLTAVAAADDRAAMDHAFDGPRQPSSGTSQSTEPT